MLSIRNVFPGLAALALLFAVADAAWMEGQPLFGPTTYPVKERYGVENVYTETITLPKGPYLVLLQTGERPNQLTDLIRFSVNGAQILRQRHYGYAYLACFLPLEGKTVLEIMVRDYDPPAFKRPALVAKRVTVTIVPSGRSLTDVVIGAQSPEGVRKHADAMLNIRTPESASLARTAAGLQQDEQTRLEAVAALAARKDPDAAEFLTQRYLDPGESVEVRSEAAVGLGRLGDRSVIPALFRGLLDPDEKTRKGSARALALFPEQDTRELFVRTFSHIEGTMSGAVMRTLIESDWRPIGPILELVQSSDADVANNGVVLLAGTRERAAVDLLLRYLDDPGPREVRLIISVLGRSGDQRAVQPLMRMATDAERRQGRELELGFALTELGDAVAADTIGDLINRIDPRKPGWNRLVDQYRKMLKLH